VCPHRLACSDRAFGKRARGDGPNDAQRDTGLRDVGAAHRVAIHRRVAERRHVTIGHCVFGEHRAERVE